MVDLIKTASLLEAHGFKDVKFNPEFLGSPFNVIASRGGRYTLLIEHSQRLDFRESDRIANDFIRIDDDSKGYWGRFDYFTYCVLTEAAEGDAASSLLGRVNYRIRATYPTFKKGGGDLILVETSTGNVARCPSFHHLQRELAVKKLQIVIRELLGPPNPPST